MELKAITFFELKESVVNPDPERHIRSKWHHYDEIKAGTRLCRFKEAGSENVLHEAKGHRGRGVTESEPLYAALQPFLEETEPTLTEEMWAHGYMDPLTLLETLVEDFVINREVITRQLNLIDAEREMSEVGK